MAVIVCWTDIERGTTDVDDQPPTKNPVLIENVSVDLDSAGDTTVNVRYCEITEWAG